MIRISPSALSTVLDHCALKYYYQYIEQIKTPPSAALLRGNAVHFAADHNFRFKMQTGKDLPEENLASMVSQAFGKFARGYSLIDYETDKWKQEWDIKDIKWDSAPGKSNDDCVRMIKALAKEVFPKYHPLGVEEKFVIPFDNDGFLISGITDIRCNLVFPDYIGDEISRNIIVDWKTANKSWPANRCHTEYSPYIYGLSHLILYGTIPEAFVFEVAAPLIKSVKLEPHVTYRTGEQIKTFMQYVIAPAVKMIESGIFPACLTGWMCSPNYCGYYKDVCQARKAGKTYVLKAKDDSPAS